MMTYEGDAIMHSGDSGESPEVEREYRVITFEDIGESVFKHMSDYQRTLLARYCARSTYHDLSEALGISGTAVSHAIHGAEVALREGLVEKFGEDVNHLGDMFPNSFQKEIFYRGLYEHVLGVGVMKGYVEVMSDLDFVIAREGSMKAERMDRILKKTNDALSMIGEAVECADAQDLPGLYSLIYSKMHSIKYARARRSGQEKKHGKQ